MTPSPYTIKGSMTARVHVSARAGETLAREVGLLGASRVFLIAGATLTHSTPHVRALEATLGTRHAGTFTGISPHAPLGDIAQATRAAREAKADLIVTVGGGAQTDAGKIVGLALRAGVADVRDLLALSARCDWARIDANDPALAPEVPVICIPTTLSGGEFCSSSGSADDHGRKQPFHHRASAPVSIILDPWLATATPEWLWLSTGVRAVDHAVEALASLQSNAYCDAMAQSALRFLAPSLRRIKAAPDDIDSRSRCQVGAWLAMQPLVSGVPMGASHVLGHALGASEHVPHGYTSCIFMPRVQSWNAPAIPARHALIDEALGGRGEPVGGQIARFVRDLGLPGSLKDLGIDDSGPFLARIAELAISEPWIKTNPRPVSSSGDLVEILQIDALEDDRAFNARIAS